MPETEVRGAEQRRLPVGASLIAHARDDLGGPVHGSRVRPQIASHQVHAQPQRHVGVGQLLGSIQLTQRNTPGLADTLVEILAGGEVS